MAIRKEIILGEDSFKDKLKKTIYYSARVRGAKKSWTKRHSNLFSQNPSYNTPCDSEIEHIHIKLWKPFRSKCDLSTLRICTNISGNSDPKIIPEDVFISDIEPSLTIDSSVNYLSIKSFYNRWFPDGLFPKDHLHNIDGQYMDSNLNQISFDEFKQKSTEITYPVVFKPNKDSYGGQGIRFIKESGHLINHAESTSNFVVQEKIDQHKFFREFNPVGLNTFRVYLYRSVKSNQLHILNIALRMGKDGSLDNETAGGIHTMIDKNGSMNGYAVDKFGTKYMMHPDTGLTFDKQIPDIEGLKILSKKIGSQIFLTKIIGLDACLDDQGNWRAIEINTQGHTVRFSQYGGLPFFGDFTHEVIDYCRENHWALQG